MKQDINSRDELNFLINKFSEKLKTDAVLAPYFEKYTGLNWEVHESRMVDFWNFILFNSTEFNGDVLGKHSNIFSNMPFLLAHFEQWIMHFKETIDEHFEGKKSNELKNFASHIANVLKIKLIGTSTNNLKQNLAFE
ncbi:MAG: group III truncated hemoglobin [Bacteroidota bacterium]|nr:group III truncated hemoglobin [Bacteroidota bacterium]